MSTVFQNAALMLGRVLKGTATRRVAGRTVLYCRGPLKTVEIVGWVAMREYEVSGDESWPVAITSFDWTFVASEIVIAGEMIVPRAGDRIKETLNGNDVVYEVMPLDQRPAVEWLDSSGLLMLAHTKQVGIAATP